MSSIRASRLLAGTVRVFADDAYMSGAGRHHQPLEIFHARAMARGHATNQPICPLAVEAAVQIVCRIVTVSRM